MPQDCQSFTSPDGSYVAKLSPAGEVAWGPEYFALEIGHLQFGDRIFGMSLCWSNDSAMLAIQEWLTTDRQLGPVTQLTVIDIVRERQCALATAHKGFIVVTKFVGRVVAFQEQYWGRGATVERQAELPPPGAWTWLNEVPRQKQSSYFP